MSLAAYVRSEFVVSWHSFFRWRTVVFFMFFFPAIIVVIFGAFVQTQPTGGGLFVESKEYYTAGHLAAVVLFTPLSRVGSTIVRHRDGGRLEELATAPLSRAEWLLTHSLVNAVVIGLAALLLLALSTLVTGASIPLTPVTLAVVLFAAFGVTLFCGLGAVIGSVADSQDGVIVASNTIVLPLLLLSETFVTPDLLPAWFVLALNLSSLVHFARGVRALIYGGGGWLTNLAALTALAVIFLVAGTVAIPRADRGGNARPHRDVQRGNRGSWVLGALPEDVRRACKLRSQPAADPTWWYGRN